MPKDKNRNRDVTFINIFVPSNKSKIFIKQKLKEIWKEIYGNNYMRRFVSFMFQDIPSEQKM